MQALTNLEWAALKQPFRLGKIKHHQTLMLEILRWVPLDKVISLLNAACSVSHMYLIKYFSQLHLFMQTEIKTIISRPLKDTKAKKKLNIVVFGLP